MAEEKLAERIIYLESLLVSVRQLIGTGEVAEAVELLSSQPFEPTEHLDHWCDVSYRLGWKHEPHPCADSICPESRDLARRTTEELEAGLA